MLLSEIDITPDALRKLHADNKVIGQGAQGTAMVSNKANTVRKVYGLNDLRDPYYRFIETIRHNKANLFFPRIYRHSIYKNAPFPIVWNAQDHYEEGRRYYNMTGVVMMEKLYPLTSKVSRELIMTMFSRLGVVANDIGALGQIFEDRAAVKRLAAETTNNEFAKALHLVLLLDTKSFDLHFNNWMVRLTSTGPQLVILDPVVGD